MNAVFLNETMEVLCWDLNALACPCRDNQVAVMALIITKALLRG